MINFYVFLLQFVPTEDRFQFKTRNTQLFSQKIKHWYVFPLSADENTRINVKLIARNKAFLHNRRTIRRHRRVVYPHATKEQELISN